MKSSFFALIFCLTLTAQAQPETVYVGTYTIRGSKGIYVYDFDRKTGSLTLKQTISDAQSPSFLAIHPSGKYLYAVNETAARGPRKVGAVSAFALDKATGKLRFLNEQSSTGNGPCYISIDKTGHCAFVANYGGGNFAILPIAANGTLGIPTDSVQFTGSGPNTARQEAAHAHSATISPDNRFLYVCDLGSDKIFIYAIDAAHARVKPAQVPFMAVTPGGGPRHFTFHPTGNYAYLVEELTSTVAVFSRNKQTGALTLLEDGVKTLPNGFTGQNTSADIHVDASGKFLYQSNRGANELTIFSIGANGKLTTAGHQSTAGKTPRNFLIDPKGEFVFVANQDTDNVVVFRRDAKTGQLISTGKSVSVPAPVCVLIN